MGRIDDQSQGPGASDFELLQGDSKAFEDLVKRYNRDVYNICYKILKQRQDAENAYQETWTNIFRSRDRFDRTRDFKRWLSRIARNAALNILRRRIRMQSRIAKGNVEDLAGGPDAARAAGSVEENGLITSIPPHCWYLLTQPQAEALWRRYVLEWPRAKIAQKMEMSEGVLHGLIYRAMAKLRACVVSGRDR